MESWSRLCFLVLAISSICRGQNTTMDPPGVEKGTMLMMDVITNRAVTPQVTPPPLTDGTQNKTSGTTAPSSSPQSQTSVNATDRRPTDSTTPGEETLGTTEEVNGGVTASGSATLTVEKEETPTAGNASTPVTIEEAGHSSLGYVILVFIILVIIILCVILYFIRRLSRTYSYSFNLNRQAPANHLNEPIGTFEQVYLDDLDRPSSKDQATAGDLSLPAVSNGTTLPSEDRRSNGESAPQGQPDANGTEASPTSNTSPSLCHDPPSPLSCTNMFFDATGEEQQNENNNNNPSVCSSDPFVEINLDEAALSDQLLTSLEAPSSSVLPFSPFSFSSSSSSSSSSLSSLHLH